MTRHLACAAALLLLLWPADAAAQPRCDPSAPELCDLPVSSQIEQPDLARAVDIVFIGDGFTDLDDWRDAANDMIDTIRAQTRSHLYPAVPQVYNFHIIDLLSQTDQVTDSDTDDTALGSRASGAEVITLNQYRASLAASNAPDVDVVFTISNTLEGRANAYYPSAIASGGSVRMSLQRDPATHELGHAIIRLADEYNEESRCDLSPESALTDLRNVTGDATCYKYQTTPGAGCVEGNHYCRRGRYRAAAQCLMRSTGDTDPCPVCRRAIQEVLLQRRTGHDAAAPWVVIHAPAPGAAVTGPLTVQVRADDSGHWPLTVALELDGAWQGQLTLEGPSGALTLDTAAWTEGPHALTATVTDRAGHTRRGAPTPITVQRLSDEAAPALQLLFPSPGATVSGVTLLNAQALQDGVRAEDAEIIAAWLDDHLLGARAGSFLGLTWDSAAFTPGLHHLTLFARDFAQNERRTDPIPLLIAAPGAPPAPGLDLLAPAPWSAVGDDLVVQLSLTDLPAGADAALWLDDAPLRDLTADTTALLLDARAWAPGPHQLTLVATLDGHTWRSNPRPVVRAAPAQLTAWLLPDPRYADAQTTHTLAAAGPDPIARLELETDAYGVVAAGAQSPARLTWDAAALPEGCVQARAVATDRSNRVARSAWGELCVSHQGPRVTLAGLPARASAGPHLARVEVDNGALTLPARLALWIDGEPVAEGVHAQGSVEIPVELSPGLRRVEARAEDALGRQSQPVTVDVQVERCDRDAACDDGRRCTTDRCAPAGRCLHALQPGCCDGPDDCQDGDPCTNDACVAGACAWTNAPGCCQHDGQCQGEDPCVLGRCVEGACQAQPNPACCDGDADCDDARACTAGACVGPGLCAQDRAPGCCDDAADCDDHDPCTADTCDGAACAHAPIPGCCAVGADCDDGDPCTNDRCDQSTCAFDENPFCCRGDADCATLDPCVTATCDLQRQRCVQRRQPNCCTFDAECVDLNACTLDTCAGGACQRADTCCRDDAGCDDGDRCTADTCDDGACGHAPIPGCCDADADCDDDNPCTDDACDGGACASAPISGCCDDDADCADGDPCTEDTCVSNACQARAITGCCLTDADCDDSNACTADACQGNACAARGVPGCCDADADCDDNNPCTADACDGDTCAFAPTPGCCLRRDDCDDDNPCTADACVSNTCQTTPIAGCCVDALGCDDDNVCTTDACEANACAWTRNRDCCLQDLDCDDGNLCTRDACVSNTCQRRGIAGCCFTDAHCDDRDPCTLDTCQDNACAHAPSGSCCLTDADCDDGELCSEDFCEDNQCRRRRIPGCCFIDRDCDDGDPCTADACLDNRCRAAQQLDCCDSDADCDDGDPCTADLCQGDACLFAQEPRCCRSDADCDDGDPCTNDACQGNACQRAPAPGCCLTDTDCDDNNLCTEDACRDGACAQDPTPGCCLTDADCADDDPCTADACVSNACQNQRAAGCCATDADCDDGDGCTTDRCEGGACAWGARPGCCASDADCDDGDPCTRNVCEASSCALDPVPGCCATDADCDDGDPCTTDACAGGACASTQDRCADLNDPDAASPPTTRRSDGGCATSPARPRAPALAIVALFAALASLTRSRSNRQRATPRPARPPL